MIDPPEDWPTNEADEPGECHLCGRYATDVVTVYTWNGVGFSLSQVYRCFACNQKG